MSTHKCLTTAFLHKKCCDLRHLSVSAEPILLLSGWSIDTTGNMASFHAHKLLSDIVFAAILFRGHLSLGFWQISNLSDVMPRKKYEASPSPSPLLCTNTQVTCLDGQQTQMENLLCVRPCVKPADSGVNQTFMVLVMPRADHQGEFSRALLSGGWAICRCVPSQLYKVKKMTGDFPGDSVVKNPPCNSEDMGSISGWGTRIPHTSGLLSPRVTAGEKFPCHN